VITVRNFQNVSACYNMISVVESACWASACNFQYSLQPPSLFLTFSVCSRVSLQNPSVVSAVAALSSCVFFFFFFCNRKEQFMIFSSILGVGAWWAWAAVVAAIARSFAGHGTEAVAGTNISLSSSYFQG